MYIKRTLSALIVVVFISVRPTESKNTASSTQTQFSAEDAGVQKPVTIPDGVLAILKQDAMVRAALANAGTSSDHVPLSWFSASAIRLSSRGETDLVVMGEEDLRGSNVVTFWVFCAGPRGYRLVLTAPAHDLIVKKTRWNGYREIEMVAATASTISTGLYRFNGTEYVLYRSKTEDIH